MKIDIVYALPQQQYLESIDVGEDTTLEQALEGSQLLSRFPALNLADHKVGIFGKLGKMTQVLHDGDRIEIYRSLPKKARNAHASDDKKERIRAKKARRVSESTS
ncbi:MAG: RnfH family protein [Mariprofundaceae bacterium]|nr:RnfH family protein [Mariprofundaceae bacterium]